MFIMPILLNSSALKFKTLILTKLFTVIVHKSPMCCISRIKYFTIFNIKLLLSDPKNMFAGNILLTKHNDSFRKKRKPLHFIHIYFIATTLSPNNISSIHDLDWMFILYFQSTLFDSCRLMVWIVRMKSLK